MKTSAAALISPEREGGEPRYDGGMYVHRRLLSGAFRRSGSHVVVFVDTVQIDLDVLAGVDPIQLVDLASG